MQVVQPAAGGSTRIRVALRGSRTRICESYSIVACGKGELRRSCVHDLNDNGVVNAADLAQLLGAWGPCPEPCTPGLPSACAPDFAYTCTVNAADLAQLLGAWGSCP